VFCVKSLKEAYDAAAMFDAAGVQNVAALGPFKATGQPITYWHLALHSKMNDLTPQLEACAMAHPNGRGGIAYAGRVHEGPNLCGIVWADVIDFMEPSFFEWLHGTPAPPNGKHGQYDADENTPVIFGNSLLVCRLSGEHERQDGRDDQPCDVVHASTAGFAYDLVDMNANMLCNVFDVLRSSKFVCPPT